MTDIAITDRRPADRPLPPAHLIEGHVRLALDEDLGTGEDLTAALVPEGERSSGEVVAREEAVLCGCAWFEAVFRLLDPAVRVSWNIRDGQRIAAGDRICRLVGPSRVLLTGERTALNYLQTLSATATRARRYAEAVVGLPVRVLDTRKTLPGLRVQQKYAVVCGGCHNHRQGLFDAILIKENHIRAAGSIPAALQAARALGRDVPIEIEVESLEELDAALSAGARHILLDNFSLADLRQAVALNAARARLEASGGVSLQTIRAIAGTGVNDVSVGDLTKDLKAVDLSMRILDGQVAPRSATSQPSNATHRAG